MSWRSLEEELLRLERNDPDVARAAASYERTKQEIIHNRGLRGQELRDLYDLSKPVPDFEAESAVPPDPTASPQEESPGQS